ncbi:unnamed protein product [Linum trigynum]|uniref:Uncharacterized protein n=1 Tax=Linum trigynum TaxID=586398 RepID=A0AAV2E9V9_9ROSI
MLLILPPPTGDSSLRIISLSAPGADMNTNQEQTFWTICERNGLKDEAVELDKREKSALLFEKPLEMLMLAAEKKTF